MKSNIYDYSDDYFDYDKAANGDLLRPFSSAKAAEEGRHLQQGRVLFESEQNSK